MHGTNSTNRTNSRIMGLIAAICIGLIALIGLIGLIALTGLIALIGQIALIAALWD